MEKLLQLKAGAVFLLLFIIPLVLQVAVGVNGSMPDDIRLLVTNLVNFLGTGLYCAWMYAACTKLCQLLPEGSSLSIGKVRLLLALPAFYIVWALFNSLLFFLVPLNGPLYEYLLWVQKIALVVVLATGVSFLCALYYMARLLKTIEYGSPVSGSDCVGDFFRIWIFPFGIWNIQPRLNDIATRERAEDLDIFKQDTAY